MSKLGSSTVPLRAAKDAHPIFPQAIGIDLDYPGYGGHILPFPDQSQDGVFASHALEHISDYRNAIAGWFRVLLVGHHLIMAFLLRFLYERKLFPLSRWNGDHKRFDTAASLMAEVEETLDPLSYRVWLLEENEQDFDYAIPPDRHAGGRYKIVLVLERIARPAYTEMVLNERSEDRGAVPPGAGPVRAAEPVVAGLHPV